MHKLKGRRAIYPSEGPILLRILFAGILTINMIAVRYWVPFLWGRILDVIRSFTLP